MSSRRRPVETNETVTLLVDSLITAIGEQQDTEALNAMGVPLDKNGWPDVDHNGETRLTDVFMIGDVQRGPFIVAAVLEPRVGRPMPSLVGKISVLRTER